MMIGRRRISKLAVLGAMGMPTLARARRRRPSSSVTVHDNHPLQVTIRDEVSAPRPAVWEAVRRTEQWDQWVPLTARSDMVQRPGESPALAATVDLPWPVMDRRFLATKRAISVRQVWGRTTTGGWNGRSRTRLALPYGGVIHRIHG